MRYETHDGLSVPIPTGNTDLERENARLAICDGLLTLDEARTIIDMLGLR
jgi:hypothetical protein